MAIFILGMGQQKKEREVRKQHQLRRGRRIFARVLVGWQVGGCVFSTKPKNLS